MRSNSERRGPVRRLGRAVAAGTVSLAVVAVAGLYLMAPTTPALALDVSAHAASHAAGRELLYGDVLDFHGHVVHHVLVEIETTGRGRHRVALIHPTASGEYRVAEHLARGRYEIVLVVDYGGHRLMKVRDVVLGPGRDYRVVGHVTLHDVFTLLPVSSY